MVTLTQTRNFLATSQLSKTVTIAAGHTTKNFTVAESIFQTFAAGTAVGGGNLTATVQDGTDYDLGTTSAVDVSITILATIGFDQSSYTVGEETSTLTVKLIASAAVGALQPTSNTSTVTVNLIFHTASAQDLSTSFDAYQFLPTEFSITSGVWQAEESLNITINNDALDEDDETFDLEIVYQVGTQHTPLVDASGNSCGTTCTVTVTIVDDDTAGVSVSKSAITVTEENTTGDTYTVVLDSQPTATVTITIGGQDAADITATPTPLTFTTTNWATAQTVTVTASNDTDTVTDTHSLTHSAASSDTDYSGIPIDNVGVTVNDNDSAIPALSFDAINITVDEDDSQATLSVLLSQASADTVTVDYATSDSTARAGDDYTATSGTLTFAPGETSKTVSIMILNDGVYEPTESFSFTLSNPTGATLPNFPGAQVSIHDDESPPTASIANVTVSEGTGTMTLTLDLSHESSKPTGYFTTTADVGGTATQGADYVNFISGSKARITVPAGDTQASLDITITDDTDAENSETITIHWAKDASGSNGDVTPATIAFTGTITDNDSGDNTATGKPGITGAAQVGMTLTAGTADIVDDDGLTSPGYTYQWLKEGSDISGQTGSTYTPTSSDIGKNIKVKVDFTDDANNAESLTSDETTAVVPAAITCPTDTTWCSILTTGYQTPNSDDEFFLGLGTTVGTTSESFGSLAAAAFTHLGLSYAVTQILVDPDGGSALIATSPNLPDDGAGLTLSVQQVSGQRDIPLSGNSYRTVTFLPATTKAWQLGFALNSSLLQSDPSTAPLLRGFGRAYDPYIHPTDEDTEVTIWLTFANRTADGAPAISGTAQVGETLTAGIGDIADADGLPTTFPGGYTFQWLRVDADGVSNQTPIGTATTTYTPVAADTGKKIKVQVTFTDVGGTAETLTSAAYPSSGTIMTPPTPTTPPGQVFGVNITPSDQTLQVNWTRVTGATGYKVQWKSGGQSYDSSRQATVSSGSTTSRTISNLQNGTEYTIRVIATKTGVSDGTPSADAMGTPTAANTVPTAPRDLNATAVGDTRINLSWDAPSSDGGSAITGYRIEVSTNGNSWTTRVANTTSRTYSHTGLSAGDTRHYRVSAINASGTGPHSNVARATTGLPQVNITPATTTEGGDIVFVITIYPPIDGFLSVGYGTGTDSLPAGSMGARKDDDYVPHHPAGARIQIGYGLTSVELRFTTVDDDLVEGTEIFAIGLYPSAYEDTAFSYGTRMAIATIRDDENGGQAYQDSVPGDTSTNQSISPGNSVQNRIETVNDADWYRTTLTENHCYQIKVEGSSADETLTLQYPAVRGVYRSDGTHIMNTYENADGRGTTAIGNVKLDTTATYYIAAGLYRFENGGTFRMSLTDLGTTDTSCGAAKPGGPMQISVADATMSESSDRRKYMSFIVTLDRRADKEVRVNYTTVNGTAVAGQDYEATSGTLVFDQGEDSKTVDVPIEYDSNDEDDETLTFVLSNARGAQIEDSVATGTIVDYE